MGQFFAWVGTNPCFPAGERGSVTSNAQVACTLIDQQHQSDIFDVFWLLWWMFLVVVIFQVFDCLVVNVGVVTGNHDIIVVIDVLVGDIVTALVLSSCFIF